MKELCQDFFRTQENLEVLIELRKTKNVYVIYDDSFYIRKAIRMLFRCVFHL
jgi:hypothetical protein